VLDLDGKGNSFLGVYDGHAGRKAAKVAAQMIHDELLKRPAFLKHDYETALKEAFITTDNALWKRSGQKPPGKIADLQNSPSKPEDGTPPPTTATSPLRRKKPDGGTTAVVALFMEGTLYVANAGDSRCVLCRKGEAVAMSEDHKPTNKEEEERIRNAGGSVFDGRVGGQLAVSRALGDLQFKCNGELGPEGQMVTCVPDVRKLVLNSDDEFVILACDGIWDVMDNAEAVAFVRDRLVKGEKPLSRIIEQMFDHCITPGPCSNTLISELCSDPESRELGADNMTCVVAVLPGKYESCTEPAKPVELTQSDTGVEKTPEVDAKREAGQEAERKPKVARTDSGEK